MDKFNQYSILCVDYLTKLVERLASLQVWFFTLYVYKIVAKYVIKGIQTKSITMLKSKSADYKKVTQYFFFLLFYFFIDPEDG